MSQLTKPKPGVLVAYLLPGVIIFSLCSIVPLVVSFWYSLHQWSGGPSKTFIGLANYGRLLGDRGFWSAFKNNVVFMVFSVVGQIGIAFVLTMFMIARVLRPKVTEFYRTVIFFPVILSQVVVGLLWAIIYGADTGLLNWALRGVGLEGSIRPWLDDPNIVLVSLAIPKIWQYIGLYLVIFMAAVQGISKEIFEVAEIDGANGCRRAIHITLPLMMPTIRVALTLCIAGNMKTFSQIYVMTSGGPGNSSMVLALYAYQTSFFKLQLGYGNALAMGILLLSLALIIISRRILEGKNA